MRTFPAVRIEGGLFAPDLFEQILAEELPGQRPRDFGLNGHRSLTDEIAAAFADAQMLWRVFQHRLERLRESESGTSVTRDAWVIPFLGLLGYELHYNRKAYDVDGLSFAISHRAGEADDAPPVHIVSVRQELGRVAESGRPRLAPHSLVQEFLNRRDVLWGLVTNGRILRLLRNVKYIRRLSYLEFDLEAIFEQHLFESFSVLYRLLHRTRLPFEGADAHQCLLEEYYQHSIEQGSRVRDRLRDGVEECLKRLANGFLAHPKNDALRHRIRTDANERERIEPEELYRQLLRLVYRLLFLFVSEDRGLISQSRLYMENYSVSRLRRLVDNRTAYTEHTDLWHSLRVLWKVLCDDTPIQQFGGKPLASALDLPVLNGELFKPLDLDNYNIANRDLLNALWYLVNYQESPNSPPRRVNYSALDVEELGSVYESLLDYQPYINTSGSFPRFELIAGSERKSTGSYYTPTELVAELINSALEPVIEERLKPAMTREEKERALLSIRVLDPACGSGHFLLAAARRLGKELARVRTGEDEPPPERVREAIRDVVAHCIYGVDKNPLAVELCRVALWIESHVPNRPLTFLDHRIKCGDSLVGVFDLKVLTQGIPDEAFSPVSDDDRKLASGLKRRNREELRQRTLSAFFEPAVEIHTLSTEARALDAISDDSPEAIREKYRRFKTLQNKAEPDRIACNIWTAAFFQPRNDSVNPYELITTDTLFTYLERGVVNPQVAGRAEALAQQHRFFHWPIEFPEVFEDGGFDVVLGNPPWEQIQLEEKNFFSTCNPEIAHAPNASTRKRLIQKLSETNPTLWQEYQKALHATESISRFLRGSTMYPSTGQGRINTYSVFAERMRLLLRPGGRAGIIVPTGIATDNTNKDFFASLVEEGELVSLFDFENRRKIFPAVDSRYKFSLLTIQRRTESDQKTAKPMKLAFFCTHAEHLHEPQRVFTLTPEEIRLLNPNTRTLPIFRTRQDAELTKKIYSQVPVLINEHTKENPWGVIFRQGLFNMSSDSHLFRRREQLEGEGFHLIGNKFIKGDKVYLPLYEAKMIWHYDHRYGTYEGVHSRTSTHLPTPNDAQHANPSFLVQPWYWVPAEEVEARLRRWRQGWLVGFRDVARSTDERTAIFGLLPKAGVGNSIPIINISAEHNEVVGFIANVKSLVFDWIVRQKLSGVHMNFFYVQQLPILPPSTYSSEDLLFIVPRVVELIYTAWDIKPFADDVWQDADETLRRAIHMQWEENAEETGGNDWSLPHWIEAYPEIEINRQKGIPLPPFRWDPERRARLQAELDAYYARLYGLTRKQLRYILDPADLTEKELHDILDPWEEVQDPLDPDDYKERVEKSKFHGETFRVLKEKELRRFGEYKTRYLVLEAWEWLTGVEPEYVAKISTKARHRGFERYNQAAVLSFVVHTLGRSDIGRVGHDKVMYFVQEHIGINLGLNFERKAAGPWDPALKYKVERLAKNHDWLVIKKERGISCLEPGPSIHEAIKQAKKKLGEEGVKKLEELCVFFNELGFGTAGLERWATIHKCWKDLKRQGKPVTEEMLIREVLQWKGERSDYTEKAISRAIHGMKEKGLIKLGK